MASSHEVKSQFLGATDEGIKLYVPVTFNAWVRGQTSRMSVYVRTNHMSIKLFAVVEDKVINI